MNARDATRDSGDAEAAADRVELVARTLGVEAAVWRRVLTAYASAPHAGESIEARLRAAVEAWVEHGPRAPPVPLAASTRCPVCRGEARAWIARGDPHGARLVAGRCATCGHAVLLVGAVDAGLYATPSYYERVDPETRAGYASYEADRAYREAKAERLLDRIERATHRRPRAMLELGSGFGFTRAVAEARGTRTTGVDLSPHAADGARRLYGLDTHVGDLASAVRCGAVAEGAHDLVVAQFVLEHVVDPAAELGLAASALAPGGVLALVAPSSEALEIDVFGGSYRSLRADHLHLFSRRSLETLLAGARLETLDVSTGCSLHLLRGFLTPDELERHVYGAGLGPDITLLARKPA